MTKAKKQKEIFLVLLNDRHCGLEIEAYTSAEVAVERAKEFADEYDYHDTSEDVHQHPDWLYYHNLDDEGSSDVVVQRVAVNN